MPWPQVDSVGIAVADRHTGGGGPTTAGIWVADAMRPLTDRVVDGAPFRSIMAFLLYLF